MASRNFSSNRIYNWHIFPVQIDAQVSIGSSGAPTIVTSTSISGSSPAATQKQSVGIKSITRLSTGRYQVQLDDNFASLLDLKVAFAAPVTGSAIPVDLSDAGLSVGTVYQMVTVGTTTTAEWHTLGVPAGITPAAGVIFKATAVGLGVGNGTVKAIGNSAPAYTAQIIGDPNTMLNNQPFQQGGGGGFVNFQCLGPTTPGTSSADATPAPIDPTSGSVMYIKILLSNSSVQ